MNDIKADIEHDQQRQCFVISVGGQEVALDYRMPTEAEVEFTHTYVPENLRGQGLAEAIVRAGLAWAKEQGLTIKSSCWYVSRFL